MPYIDMGPSRAEIFSYWKDSFRDIGIFIDWGEPSCWACGFHYGTKYDVKSADASWKTILGCWQKIPLQRCHIVPRSLGGSDGPSNRFLMCRECHDLQPNTPFPDIFFEWVRAQSHIGGESLQKWKKRCGVSELAKTSIENSTKSWNPRSSRLGSMAK
ncbi:HNH endonuclease [Bradyrhizobium erythrophlei]|uniref:HNH endonuclease n=1 Tax=Bradyrhizobium erythrophlei TaxID=1437360 RepID=A0A1M7UXK8_9BRAD|nr:HNH endonuclease [Bradyrhizobium erythrophlei]SHN87660.1 HNH endonuclease [Bradyrhizobium erythrophlei]